MEKVDLEALDAMRAAAKSVGFVIEADDLHAAQCGHYLAALHNAYPAMAAELRALPEERDRLREDYRILEEIRKYLMRRCERMKSLEGMSLDEIAARQLEREDTLRAEAARLQEALDPIARAYQVSMKPFAPGIDEADGAQHWMPHGWPSVADFKAAAAALSSTPTTAEWLSARDEQQRRIGAAEELEKLGEWCRCGDINPDDARDEIARACKNRAAQLRKGE